VAVAQRLYEEAKTAMAQQDFTSACQKFAESNRLDPATGGTLLNLAVCHEKLGKIATASAEFEDAAQLARHYGRADRERLARDHIEKLRAFVSILTLRVPDEVASIAGLTISIDGVPLGRPAWDGIPVDPGTHTVRAEAPGKASWSANVTIGAAATKPTVELAPLADAPVAPPALPAPPAPVLAPSPSATPIVASDGGVRRGADRTAAFVVGGLGVTGLVVGSVFGITALQLNASSKRNCDAPQGSAAACGSDLDGQHASIDANVSNVAFGVGIVGLGVAAYVLLTAPRAASGSSSNVRIVPAWTDRGGSVGLQGAW
jgi:hypothetical protein